MFTFLEVKMKKNDFIKGIKDGFPICLGYFSVSMAFGITAVLSGLPIWSAIVISLTNLTSAGQFAGANIIIENGAFIELAITTLIINIRYFLMSLSVSQKVDTNMSLRHRFAISFGITDEIFAVSMQNKSALSSSYMAGLILTPLIGWTAGTTVGAMATSFMPQILSNAMGIALYGMFIAIIIPPAREKKNVMFAVVLSIIASLVFTYLPPLSKLSEGWSIIIIAILVSAVAATFFPINTENCGEVDQ